MQCKKLIPLLLTALLLTSCADKEDFPESRPARNDTAVPENPTDLAAAAKNPTGAEADKRFTEAVTVFSESLFRRCVVPGENLILSPLSLTHALTLTSNGAYGDTLAEFEALNGGIPVAEMNEYLFWNALTLASTQQSTVDIANSVWTDEGFPVNSQFKWVAQKYYNADAFSLPFAEQSTADAINQWVSDNTDGMIPRVMDNPPTDKVMLLLNTVLFDGKWEIPYEEYQLSDAVFRNADGTETAVTLMHSFENTYFEGDGFAGFSKTYLDGYRFVALLPDAKTDVFDFAASLDWRDAIDKALRGQHSGADCYLPKFEAEWEMGLNEILNDMGLVKAFTGKADLRGLAETGGENLYISSVKQKAKISVHETGTKAAAYTQIDIAECVHPSICLDRPFVYAIVDGTEGIPLFMGITAYLE